MFLQFQQIRMEAGQSFFAGRFRRDVFDYPYSFHPEIELALYEKGHCTIVAGETAVKVKAGDLILLGSNTPHFHQNNPADSKGPEWAGLALVVFGKEVFGRDFAESPEFIDARRFLDSLDHRAYKPAGKTLERLRALVAALPDCRKMERMIRLLELIQVMMEAPGDELIKLSGMQELSDMHRQDIQRMNRFFRYVHEHIDDEIRLEDAAKLAGMAPSSFSRFFHQKTGQTFQQYVVEQRLNAACIRLMQSEDTVIEIAYSCGFNNLSNFNRHFRKHHGMTPQEFRKAWRKTS